MQIKCGEGNNQKDMVVWSAYLLSDSVEMPLPTEFKELLVEYNFKKKVELPVGSDTNSNLMVWGSLDINPNRESLCKYLMVQGLPVQNRGKAPTFITRVEQKALDLTICSIEAQKLIHGWRMSNEPSLSDHRYILYKTGTAQVLQ